MPKSSSSLASARRLGFFFRLSPLVLLLGSVSLLLPGGCDRKPGVKTSLSQLEKAFAANTAPGQAEHPTPGRAPGADANGCVQIALVAARSNDYATAVAMLNTAVRAPGMTPDQFLAVQQAKNALLTDLLDRARKGDATAQTALKVVDQFRAR
jgi:hypothetical protein